MSSICIIPARGGSKRIPRKNIREFCGKPIIAYSIEAALGSGLFDEVMVSTDDDEIAEVAQRFGADVPFMRSSETSGDMATTADVLLEVLERFESIGKTFDVVCCLYATAPFVTAGKLREAWEELDDADSIIGVTSFSFPPQRGFVSKGGFVSWWMPQFAGSRSQDLDVIYHDAGQFSFVRVPKLKKRARIICENTKAYLLPELEVQDIDNVSDWQVAEQKYRFMKAKE